MDLDELTAVASEGVYFSYVAGAAAVMLRRTFMSGGLVIDNHRTTLPTQKVSRFSEERSVSFLTGTEQLGGGERAGGPRLRRAAWPWFEYARGHGGRLPGGTTDPFQLREDGPGDSAS